jgi:hypothetical protein
MSLIGMYTDVTKYISLHIKPSAREYNWATLFLGDINTGNLALQVGGVSDETVIYGREF